GPVGGDARAVRAVVLGLRNLSRAGGRQDGHGREGRPAAGRRSQGPARPVLVVRLRAGRLAEDHRLRADRERRPRRHRRGADRAEDPGALLQRQRSRRPDEQRGLMLEYAGTRTRATPRRRRSAATDELVLLRRLDWLLLGATAAIVAFGLWAIAGITRFDVPGNPSYYLMRQGIFAAVGFALFLVALFVNPDLYRR